MAIISISQYVPNTRKKEEEENKVKSMLTGDISLGEVRGDNKPSITSIRDYLPSPTLTPKQYTPKFNPQQQAFQELQEKTQMFSNPVGYLASNPRKVFGFAKDFLQSTARSGGNVVIEAAQGEEAIRRKIFGDASVPIHVNPVIENKFLFGDKPVTGFKDEGSDLLKNVGLNQLSEMPKVNYAVGGLMSFLDFTGAGKGDDVIKTLVKSDSLVEVAKILKKLGANEDSIMKYAPKIVNATDNKVVTSLLKNVKGSGDIDIMSGIKNFNISPEGKQKIIDNVEAIRPELEELKGRPLTQREIAEAAQKATVMPKIITREQTKANLAAIQRTKQDFAAMAEGTGVSKDFIDTLKIIKSQASDAGRTLKSFDATVDPIQSSAKTQIVQELLDLGKDVDDIIKRAEGVDFTNAKEASKFYRDFVPPKFGELLDEWRYGNLLSSPKTHIINAFSNLIQGTVLNPATKLASGAIDNIAAKLIGKEQEHFLSEVPAYARGVYNAIPESLNAAWQAFRGNTFASNLDLKRIPTNSKLTIIQRQFLQALEAGDSFFRTLISGGERQSLAQKYLKQGKKVTPEIIEKELAEKAEYFVFRKPLDINNKSGQGTFLTGIDKLTNGVMTARDNKLFGWLVPFVQTPMNILKQGIEYSPLGVLTLPKNANKVEQLGKTMIGSLVFAGAGYMAVNGQTTWAVPTNPKEKELFYASGRQPYSIKIGDKWISYSKLGPLAYPMAMAAATQYYWKENPKAATQSNTERTLEIITGIAKFFGDQSYVQGVSEAVGLVSGDSRGESIVKTTENLANQAIPLVSLQRWVNQMIDPVYRQTEKEVTTESIIKNLASQLISLSDLQEPYKKPNGEISNRQKPVLNALSPLPVTEEDPGYTEELKGQQEISRLKAIKSEQDEEDKARIQPTYDYVQELVKQGKDDEAFNIVDQMSDEDYDIYKRIKDSNQTTGRNDLQPKMIKLYDEVQRLANSGQMDKAEAIVNAMTDDEYSAYKSVKQLKEDTNAGK